MTFAEIDLSALITASALLVTAATAGFVSIYKQIKAVHVMVNSNNDAMVAKLAVSDKRIEELVVALTKANEQVPGSHEASPVEGSPI